MIFAFQAGTPSFVRAGETRAGYAAYGGRDGDGSHTINAWTSNWIKSQPDGTLPPPVTQADIENCSANALDLILAIMAHELFHGPGGCGEHDSNDCAGIAINIGVAGVLCEIIGELNECFCDPECPPLNDPNGQPIPGLSTDADICALAQALCDRHKDIADKTNADEKKKAAAECSCGGWSGGPNCPAIPPPPGGCPPTGDDGGYVDTPLVPPCPNCPPCQCP